MEKYELLPKQLLLEGILGQNDFFEPDFCSENDILAVHTSDYWYKLRNLELTRKETRPTGFEHNKELVDRESIIAQGTVLGAKSALKDGIAFNIAGGTHHAYSNHGEGFCLLNDHAIAAKHLQNNGLAKRVLILDLDVHQGNGTAEIFQKDETVFTFSMHGASNYPFRKETSDLDISLPDFTNDYTYLKTLEINLLEVLDIFQPDFVFYQSGVDVLKSDQLGKLGLSLEGCKQRDYFVFQTLYKRHIPVQVSMGGGYSKDIKIIVEAHTNTFRVAGNIY